MGTYQLQLLALTLQGTPGVVLLKVDVMLSTWNGGAFLAEFLASLADQKGVEIHLHVRDDGSTDSTPTIIEHWRNRLDLTFTRGENVGPCRSFFTLLKGTCPDVPYIALADQDDIWLPGKLKAAIEKLQHLEDKIGQRQKPLLYCSRVILVDEHLQPIGSSWKRFKQPGFANAIVQNIATGCTIVMNHVLARAVAPDHAAGACMHDWWLYLLAAAYGAVVFDPTPRVLYRIHAHNVIGAPRSFGARCKFHIARQRDPARRNCASRQARAFYHQFAADLEPRQRRILERFLAAQRSWGRRLRYALAPDVWTQHWLDNLLLRLLLVMGWV